MFIDGLLSQRAKLLAYVYRGLVAWPLP